MKLAFLDWNQLSSLVDLFFGTRQSGRKRLDYDASVVSHWADIEDSFEGELILCVESIYFDKTLKVNMRTRDIPYSTSARADRVQHITFLFTHA